jgi:hypothetical protein
MMEEVRTSEMSVNFNVTTQGYIPEESKYHTRSSENQKSHNNLVFFKNHEHSDQIWNGAELMSKIHKNTLMFNPIYTQSYFKNYLSLEHFHGNVKYLLLRDH